MIIQKTQKIIIIVVLEKGKHTMKNITDNEIIAEIIPTDTSVSLVDGHIEAEKGR